MLAKNHGLRTFGLPVPIQPVPLGLLWHAWTDRDPARQWIRDHIAHAAVGCAAATARTAPITALRRRRG